MNKKDKIKGLIRKYIEGELSDAEEEHLFFLIRDKEHENAVYCEQYNLWREVSEHNKHLPSEEIFNKVKEKSNITDDKLRQDDLMLKGLIFLDVRSRKRRVYNLLKYAAVLVIALCLSGLVYYMIGSGKKKEITYHEITVPYGSRIKIMLADSSVVWLNSGSKLTYPDRFAEVSREVFLEGEAFFDIHKFNRIPFYVRTYDINIKVLGTRFNVKAYPEEDMVETTLISGHIQIEENEKEGNKAEIISLLPEQKAVYLKKTQRLLLERKETIKGPRLDTKKDINLSNINDLHKIQESDIEIAWKDNQLIFRDEQFSSLAKKLERWYDVEIEIKDDEIGNYRITGSLKNETIEQALNALKIAVSLDYEIHKNKIEITKSNK